MASKISSNSSETLNSTQTHNNYDDPFFLSSSDHPGMQLTVKPFDGGNFILWSRPIRQALKMKTKLGFIDGSYTRPSKKSPKQMRWTRCDNMVLCWLLNSMLPEIAEGFMYIETSRELWNEISETFGQTNGPFTFQLRHEMANLMQDNSSIASYYNRLKRILDELQSVDPTPQCTCGALKKCECHLLKRIQDLEARNYLLQFLMGLNSSYDQTRGQILSMDPLPNVNRAHYILQQIEKQRQVTDVFLTRNDVKAFVVNKTQVKSNFAPSKKDSRKSKLDKFCDHCKGRGHIVDQCFKIHGFPN